MQEHTGCVAAKRRRVHVGQAVGARADEDDLVLEHGRIELRGLAIPDVLLGEQDVEEGVHRIGGASCSRLGKGTVQIEDQLSVNERQAGVADTQGRSVERDGLSRHEIREQNRGQPERRHRDASNVDEGRHPSGDAAVILLQVVVPECRYLGEERVERRLDVRPRDEPGPRRVGRPGQPDGRGVGRRGRLRCVEALEDGVGEADDVAGAPHGANQFSV